MQVELIKANHSGAPSLSAALVMSLSSHDVRACAVSVCVTNRHTIRMKKQKLIFTCSYRNEVTPLNKFTEVATLCTNSHTCHHHGNGGLDKGTLNALFAKS